MLRFITGRAKSGKSKYIYDQILADDNAGIRSFLIVPEQFTMEAEYGLSKMLKQGVLLNIEVISFERLAYRLVDNMGGKTAVKIDDHGKIMVLRRLFNLHKKDMQVFKRATQKEGFLSEFNNLIQEIKRNRIQPEDIEKVMNETDNTLLTRKLKDVLSIYTEFENYMAGKYLDDEDRFEALINAMDFTTLFDNTNVWIDQFNGFTSQEKAVVEKIIEKANKTTLSLTIDSEEKRDKDVFATTIRTFKSLKKNTEEKGIDTQWLPLDGQDINPEFDALERNLFSYPYKVYDKPLHNIHVYAGQNFENEVEHMAIGIINLVRDQGFKWKDIAVIKGAESYNPVLKRCFAEYDIPYFMDEKRSIMHNPIIQFLLSALTCVQKYYRQEDIVRFMKVGFLNLSNEDIEGFENFMLAFGIKGRRFTNPLSDSFEQVETMEPIRENVMALLGSLQADCKESTSVEGYTKSVYAFALKADLPRQIENWINLRKEEGQLEYAQEMTQIWNILINTIDQMIELMGDQEMTLADYIKLLEAGFSEYRLGVIPSSTDHVLIGSVNRSKSHAVKAMFVLGMNDGQIPAYSEGDGILLNDEKELLAKQNIVLPSTSELKQQEEDLAVYSVLNKASEKLFISYALADEKGSSLRPSTLIDKLKDIFPSLVIQTELAKKQKDVPVLLPRPTFKFLVKELREYVDGSDLHEVWWNVLWWYQNQPDWKESIDFAIEGLFHNNQPQPLTLSEVESVYELPLVVSTSRLERFANCPFSHFVKYGLKPRTRKVYKVEYPDIGLLFHTSVERFAQYLNEHNLPWEDLTRHEMESIIDSIIDTLADEHEYKILKSSFRYKYLINKIRRISNRAVSTLGHQLGQGDFQPLAHEMAFGKSIVKGGAPPLVIEMPNGQRLMIEGRIDRIDMYQQGQKKYIKVIDYKSGYRKFNLSEVFFGLQIQLVLYMDAVLKNSQYIVNDDLYPGGMFYFRIDDPLIEAEGTTDKEHVEKAILKALKMDGLTIKNLDVVQAMDKDLKEVSKSEVIPVALKKDETFSANSSVLEEDDMELLISYVEHLASETGTSILKGNIELAPCKTKDYIACQRCDYKSVCQFDVKLKRNHYKNIQNLSKDRVLDKLQNWSDKNAKMD